MLRPRSLTAALVGTVATAGLLAPAPATSVTGTGPDDRRGDRPVAAGDLGRAVPRGAAPGHTGTPLDVRLTEMTPAVVEPDTDITLTGTVTNTTDEDWSTVNLMAFRSEAPITDAAGLATAAESDPEEVVGTRIPDAGTFDTVETLAAGETAGFTATLPRTELGSEAGVYWIGVHALGDSPSVPSDGLADGRARTFIPLLPEDSRPVDAALVIPLRATVRHDPDGRIADPARWAKRLGPEGRLTDILRAGQAAAGQPVTWLVDPAVVQAATALRDGNPPLSLEPLPGSEGSDDEGEEGENGDELAETAVPSQAPVSPSEPTEAPSEEPRSPDDAAAAEAATAWLELFSQAVGSSTLLSLPYGDLDMSAAARQAPELYDLALQRSSEVMTGLGVAASPAIAPPSGHLSPEAVAKAPREALILLSDDALTGEEGTGSASAMLLGHQVATTSSGVAAGGPGPEPSNAPVAVRQRLLSEAALRMVADDPAPIIMVPPPTWDPSESAALYDSVSSGVLRMRDLSEVTGGGVALPAEALSYPDAELEHELPPTLFESARILMDDAALLSGVLELPAGIGVQVSNIALTGLSHLSRRAPESARLGLQRSAVGIADLLGRVTIDGPPEVTLSSDRGDVGATIANGLPEAVTVRVVALTDGGLQLKGPQQITLAPGSRRRILLPAAASRQGIHRVTLRITDSDGEPLGAATTFSVRTAQVGQVIWVIMGAGAAMLFGAIAVRLVRRLRGGATSPDDHEPQPDPGPEPDPGPDREPGPDRADPPTAAPQPRTQESHPA